MRFVSSDTNVWLDFSAIEQIALPFRLPYKYIMYKETLRVEIVSPKNLLDNLLELGLLGIEITIEEFYYAAELSSKYVKLSGYDRIALSIAKHRSIPLLTGDDPLRKAAIKEGVEVIGTIGLLDRMYEEKLITKREYRYCLEGFLVHTERRLPVEELNMRLESISERR